jgi:hypothetical protein
MTKVHDLCFLLLTSVWYRIQKVRIRFRTRNVSPSFNIQSWFVGSCLLLWSVLHLIQQKARSAFRVCDTHTHKYTRVCIQNFRTGHLERELQMAQLSATRCTCIATLWVSLVSFAAITLCIASQRVLVVVYFVIDSVQKLLDTSSYLHMYVCMYNVVIIICWQEQ